MGLTQRDAEDWPTDVYVLRHTTRPLSSASMVVSPYPWFPGSSHESARYVHESTLQVLHARLSATENLHVTNDTSFIKLPSDTGELISFVHESKLDNARRVRDELITEQAAEILNLTARNEELQEALIEAADKLKLTADWLLDVHSGTALSIYVDANNAREAAYRS